MKDRIKELRKALGLSQNDFGNRIGVSKAAISRSEAGLNGISDMSVKIICREFNVREEWLRNGSGEMYEGLTKAEMTINIVDAALKSEDDFIMDTFIALGQLTPSEWDVVRKIVSKIRSNDK